MSDRRRFKRFLVLLTPPSRPPRRKRPRREPERNGLFVYFMVYSLLMMILGVLAGWHGARACYQHEESEHLSARLDNLLGSTRH